jgi:FkbM family methyltransferase
MNYFDWPDGYNALLRHNSASRSIFSSPNQFLKNEPVVIYGAGFEGLMALRQMKELGVVIKCFCDTNSTMSGKILSGVSVVGIKELTAFPKDTPIIITPRFHSVEIEISLRGLGFSNLLISERIFGDHNGFKFYRSNCAERKTVAEQNLAKIEFVHSKLADEHSKAVFDANLALWTQGDYKLSEKSLTKETYFPEGIIRLSGNEVFIDCGAYTGDSAYEFAKQANGNYRAIYAYEADEIFTEIAKRFCAAKQLKNAHIENIGIYSKKATLSFVDEDGVGNRISGSGSKSIQVDSLDNLLSVCPYPITFIKMDIEGAEMEALLGAKGTISQYLPKLAISVYHKFGDIWEIPYYILNNYPYYRIFLRHGHLFSDFICFAVR